MCRPVSYCPPLYRSSLSAQQLHDRLCFGPGKLADALANGLIRTAVIAAAVDALPTCKHCANPKITRGAPTELFHHP